MLTFYIFTNFVFDLLDINYTCILTVILILSYRVICVYVCVCGCVCVVVLFR